MSLQTLTLVEKPLAHAAGDELLDLRGRDAQPGGTLGLIFGDHGVARRHRVAVGVESMPVSKLGRRIRVPELRSAVLAGELGLSCILKRLIDDRRVFVRMGLALVNDLAEIGAVLQDQVERPAREWLATDADDDLTVPLVIPMADHAGARFRSDPYLIGYFVTTS